MSGLASRILPLTMLAVVLLIVAGTVAYSAFAGRKLPEGPVDLVWDKTACAACGMHVGEPPFAAQLTTTAGDTLAFDDPGCLFLHVAARAPEVHAIWFRHVREDRWIGADSVAFTLLEQTPMGFGIGAVDRGSPGSIGLEEARRRCLERVGGAGR